MRTKLFITFLLFLASSVASTQSNEHVFVAIPEYNAITRSYLQAFDKHKYQSSNYKVLELGKLPTLCDKPSCVYIAVGHTVLKELRQRLRQAPIISVLTSSLVYYQTLEEQDAHNTVSAIFAEPSLRHQLDIVMRLYPKQANIGLLYSEKSEQSLINLKHAIKNYPFNIIAVKIDHEKTIAQALEGIKKADVLLAVPDSTIYNSGSLRYIILTTYRREQPIIGFSENFVRSGALGTSYTDIDHIAEETIEFILYYQLYKKLPEPDYAKKHRIVFNNAVANSLNIPVRDHEFAATDVDYINESFHVSN